MNLNERERRALNDIAERLEDEDTRLAALLSSMEPRRRRGVPRSGTFAAVVAGAVLLLAIAAAAVSSSPSAGDHTRSTSPKNVSVSELHYGTNHVGPPTAYLLHNERDLQPERPA